MKRYQVAGIGNAVVDVLSTVPERFLEDHGIRKGIMQLIERDRAEALHAPMPARDTAPGGSVANTLAGLGKLGLRTAFTGLVADDDLGRGYAADMAAQGTDFPNPPAVDAELPTSRSMIFVTPDGERSMNTYLGISAELGPDDVDAGVMAASEMVFLEGYLFDKDKGKQAFLKAARACRGAGGRAGIALSDPFCVDRHRADFQSLVANEMDFVIGNESEWVALYQVNDLDDALGMAARVCPLVVCTRSGDPVRVLHEGQMTEAPVDRLTPVDATGAGDQFAAGFLFGLVQGHGIAAAARMGCIAAAEVIGHLGARPLTDVGARLRHAGLI
ncbi:MAG: adenosine kinase [Rhodobacteraceae bacterium]|nr:adenosine kinase [Paracoccaceae bacterium]